MQTLSQQLRTEAALIARNGITKSLTRARIARLMLECADALAGADADRARLDWLADKDNLIGEVSLPRVCVMNNLSDMRAAIDEAMRLDPEVWRAVEASET